MTPLPRTPRINNFWVPSGTKKCGLTKIDPWPKKRCQESTFPPIFVLNALLHSIFNLIFDEQIEKWRPCFVKPEKIENETDAAWCADGCGIRDFVIRSTIEGGRLEAKMASASDSILGPTLTNGVFDFVFHVFFVFCLFSYLCCCSCLFCVFMLFFVFPYFYNTFDGNQNDFISHSLG